MSDAAAPANPVPGDGSRSWGPLEGLAGTWEGDGGLDSSWSHVRQEVLATPYRERVTFVPFGPVVNGRQSVYGLDYRSSMWRGDETDPFHTEVGYWLWDAASGEVMRCFVVPRGITVFGSGTTTIDATSFTLSAELGDPRRGIGESRYLSENASTLSWSAEITSGEGTWSYRETTMLRMKEFTEPFAHTDHNTLHRVA
ncbi:MAG: heme-binding beta-barrel domain-containing protein [Acidimicrobiales bacterium]|jgi:hypothetical protein|nr:heme-binding beta-barrel domain-containing protein [Acidimicrobiales bacterium]